MCMKRCFLSELVNKKIIKDDGTELKISTDTRKIQPGDFYLPLKGANFNGEDFIDVAIKKGACGFLTTNEDIANQYKADSKVRLLAVVQDTTIAYMELASARIKTLGCKVIGITGSSGKTTVKEMVYSVVNEKFKTHKTSLNYNNEIGFCQTVFDAPIDTEVLILEMGMRGLGEIELIAKYANPDISIITNVGTAHIGRLGNRKNIAIAKCEIAKFLDPASGVFIAQSDNLTKENVNFSGKQIYFDSAETQIITQKIGETIFKYQNEEYILPIEGHHNISNSLAAINVGKVLKMDYADIRNGLKNFKTIENRWNQEKIENFNIINDCYNANPESMRATIDTILTLYKNPVLILGNMGELGEDSKKYHQEIGEFINNHTANTGVTVITVGELAKNISNAILKEITIHFNTNDEVADYILKNNNIGNILFFKASRSMKFEQIINRIKGDLT